MPFFGDRLHGMLQDAVDAVLNGNFSVARFDVNVTGSPFQCGENDGLHQADYRADGAVSRQAVPGDGLFAFFFLFGNLQGECFGSLLQNALRLLRALQQVADLPGSCYLVGKFLAEQKWQLVTQNDDARVCYGNDQHALMHNQGHKVIAEHQIGGNGSKQVRIDALFLQVDKPAAIASCQPTRLRSLLLQVNWTPWSEGRIGKIGISGGHKNSLPCRSRHREREYGQIQGNEDAGNQQPHDDQKHGLDQRY